MQKSSGVGVVVTPEEIAASVKVRLPWALHLSKALRHAYSASNMLQNVSSESQHVSLPLPQSVIDGDKERILKERYRAGSGAMLAQLRQLQPWADGKLVKARSPPP